jgi:3-phosphoshikimate 1-carboxyvinyltransferase
MSATTVTEVQPARGPLSGTARVPGDKSISHRMALVAAVANARSTISGFSRAGDCEATLSVLRALGAGVDRASGEVVIEGVGWDGLRSPERDLDCGRSGTTMRLACGLLAGSGLEVILTGDPQLLARPMERVAEPLRLMGAAMETTDGRAPIRLKGSDLAGIEYRLPVASAQVKSAILLAGLNAEGTTTVLEHTPTRDHTERLLSWLDVPIEIEDAPARRVSVRRSEPRAFEASVPGDISSAAPLLAAAAAVPGSSVTIEAVGLNPTRTAFLEVLARLGAEVEIEPSTEAGPEPVGAVTVGHGDLRAVEIGENEVPGLIDELPLVGVLGALAEGTTVVRGARELRVKESDRIAGLVGGLRAMGADAEELPDGFTVTGPAKPRGGEVDSMGDHRLAMAFAVAALASADPVSIDGLDSVADSFPTFVPTLESLR